MSLIGTDIAGLNLAKMTIFGSSLPIILPIADKNAMIQIDVPHFPTDQWDTVTYGVVVPIHMETDIPITRLLLCKAINNLLAIIHTYF